MTRARDLANIADGTFTATDLDLSGTLTVSGDANFDSGTFFVDASANAVGIGTTTVNEKLVLGSADSGSNFLQITNSTTTAADNRGFYVGIDANENARIIQRENADMFFSTNNTEVMTLDASGNVGIGTSSPSTLLELSANNNSAASNNTLRFTDTDTATEANQQIGKIEFKSNDSSGDGALVRSYILSASEDTTPSSYISFGTNPGGAGNTTDERMRIDSNGNLLVGGTSAFGADTITLAPGGFAAIRNTSGSALELRRDSTDGSILDFQKDGAPVGSIGSYSNSYLYIGSEGGTDTHIAFVNGSVRPSTNDGSLLDNVLDLGNASARWKDLYLSNTAYISAPSTSTAVLQLESLDTSVVAGQSIGNISWRANDASTGGTGIRGRISCEAENAGTVYALTFATGYAAAATERMRLDSSGNLILGRPLATAANTDSGSNFYGTGEWYNYGGAGQRVRFYDTSTGGVVGTITTTTSATAYNTSSDYRLKDVDGPITNSGAYIDALKPVQGSWKADGSRFIGLIAHEVQEVSETQIATGEKDGEEMQGMSYSAPELIANLIAEIQSLRARVAQLEGA